MNNLKIGIILISIFFANSDLQQTIDTYYISSQCSIFNCPVEQGVCVTEANQQSKCICKSGYITIQDKTNQIYCNYKQKSGLIAALLEFLIPFGAGHFYIGKIYMAIAKASVAIISSFYIFGESFCYMRFNYTKMQHYILTFFCVFWFCFQIFDLICFVFGFYKDGNGIELSN